MRIVLRNTPFLFLVVACILLFVLWLPGARYPVVGDSILYSILGESIWTQGTYALFGVPYESHLPVQAFLAYPFALVFGHAWGIQVYALLCGMLILWLTFLLVRRHFSHSAAPVAPLLLILSYGFTYNMTQGAVDVPFTLFMVAGYLCYENASQQKKWYVLMGILLGIGCLSRYNGVPVVLFLFGHFLCTRAGHRFAITPWIGWILTGIPLGAWTLRNYFVWQQQGSAYEALYQMNADQSFLSQFFSNVLFYINPLHNFMPVTFGFVCVGLFLYARQKIFLVQTAIAALAIALVWPVEVVRYGIPAYPFFIGFGAQALVDWYQSNLRYKFVIGALGLLCLLGTTSFSFCAYNYGWCNAAMDRSAVFSFLPPFLGITSERQHSMYEAIVYINKNALFNSSVYLSDPALAHGYAERVFRSDIRVTNDAHSSAYVLTDHKRDDAAFPEYASANLPHWYVYAPSL